jgi:hypothetical protein
VESRPDEPEGVEVQDLGDRLRITRRWFWWTSVPLGLGALVWIGLVFRKYADNLLYICSFFFLGLGLLALLTCLLALTNRTEIEVNRQVLTIEHGPLPRFSRDKTVPIADIDQLFVKTIKTSGNVAPGSRSWALYMIDRFGEKRKLIGAIPDWNQAQFIKQEIERFLDRIRPMEREAG